MNTPQQRISFWKRVHYSVVDPVRDWIILLIFFSISLIGLIVWNVWAFDTVASGGVIGARSADSYPVFNRASLDTIHSIFEKRATEEAKYRTGSYRYADPSQ